MPEANTRALDLLATAAIEYVTKHKQCGEGEPCRPLVERMCRALRAAEAEYLADDRSFPTWTNLPAWLVIHNTIRALGLADAIPLPDPPAP